ncbi:ABC transporter ATP-binding protein [Treponema putidum]|uniref:ABC transporter ATP-binding protein n=1 Tax=Treponema putidum TaxID=221027 RepID=UPI0004F7C57D|nr:ABC transporter ATP-binding protein [Treponema putidum]AIN93653.1 multidrug ABC transporter permease [Treponema putidum]TWI77745.1 ATP-binding cassette subfamily B protein [Treponema putidum]
MKDAEQAEQKSSLKYLLALAKPCKGLLASSVIFAVFGAAAGIVPYLAVSGLIIRICARNYTLQAVPLTALIALAGYLGQLCLSTLSTIRSHRAAFTVLKNIRMQLTAKLSRVPMGFILDTPSGKFKTMLVDTVEKLELPLAHIIPELTANLLIPLLMLLYFFYLDWRLALIAFATFPLGLLCYMGMMKDYEKRYTKVLTAGKNMDAATVEYIGGIEVIKAFNQSTASYRKYTEAITENENAKAEWFKKTNPYYAAGMAIAPSSLLGVLPLGTWFFIQGSISAGNFISCIILSLGLIAPLIQALRYTDSLAMVDSTVKEIAALLEAEEMNRPKNPIPFTGNTIEFSHVSFSYSSADNNGADRSTTNNDTEVLHDLCFQTVPNGMTAFVGPSGSGKSTVARLIASFWEASAGSVMIGGCDVRKMPLSQAMEQVGYVSQDNYLFHLSIRENIRLGKPDAADAEIEQAARKASCHDFISSLPQGYDTVAGDGGNNLSGGERQRIAIARAILKDSPIIVLDEATAFTDPENEAVIQRSIGELVAGKTLIVIAHRLSTITAADKIIVMNHGKIEAEGCHQLLLESCELYHSLWNAHISVSDKKENGLTSTAALGEIV